MAEAYDPKYRVKVAGKFLPPDVQRFITRVEYESADGIADVAKLTVSNPDYLISDSKIFQTGNELEISFGYGPGLEFVGRADIAKARPNFPEGELPTLEVIAYTKDYLMMDGYPEVARTFDAAPVQSVVKDLAGAYRLREDIDPVERTITGVQKPGMSDFDLLRGLSNITGYMFWVDGNEFGEHTLHFVNPQAVGTARLQEKKYNFAYRSGPSTTLLEFEPEFAVRDSKVQLKVAIRDPARGVNFIEVITEDEESPDIKSKAKADRAEKIEGPIPSGASVKIFFGEFSLEVVTDKTFINAEDARLWAEQWFRRRKENFVVGSGTLIGIEPLRARQVHSLSGLGTAFNGDYYFARVSHVFAGDNYRTSFTARKHVPA
jgi:phage protein D